MEYDYQEGESVMADPAMVQVMFDTMIANGISPDDAGTLLRFRYDHQVPFSFANIVLCGAPTSCVVVPRGDGYGKMLLAVVTLDMRVEDTDGNKLSGPPDKRTMN